MGREIELDFKYLQPQRRPQALSAFCSQLGRKASQTVLVLYISFVSFSFNSFRQAWQIGSVYLLNVASFVCQLNPQGRGAARGSRGGGGPSRGRHTGPQAQSMEKPKREAILDLSKYVNEKIRVKFTGGREGMCPGNSQRPLFLTPLVNP